MNQGQEPSFDQYFIRTWKGVARVTGYHPQSLRRLHYTKMPLPRLNPNKSKTGRIITTPDMIKLWFKTMDREFKGLQ